MIQAKFSLLHEIYPLIRLVFFISLGVFIGNFIEALNWTRFLSKLAYPLVKFGHLKDISGASFSVAFFSGISANTMLVEAYEQGKLSKKELILSNLFNSLPTYFLHLPTTFFIIAPLIKRATLPYFSITLTAALLRTGFIVILSHFTLPPSNISSIPQKTATPKRINLKTTLNNTLKRFKKRIQKVLIFTVPIYIAFRILAYYNIFHHLESKLAGILTYLPFLPPKSLSIVLMQTAEFSSGLAAAGALLDANILSIKQVVTALIVGNILSSPIRAIRHQFPYYAGIYKPKLAFTLICFNQGLRIISLVFALTIYYLIF
ncbi:MAG: hypothetical protein Q9M37_05155 [Desulfonauticus sp.]|nr:hypothetical protein [Desulfonauticus sp.]